MLSLSGREGTLFIYEGARKRAICFTKDGVSIRSRERNEGNLLGKILIRLGRISEQDLERAVDIRGAGTKLLGEVLVANGICSQEDVELAFRIQSEEDIQDLFLNRSPDATFEYVDGYFPESDGTPFVNLVVNSLLIEIARRTDEWEYIRRRVRSPREIYRFTGTEGKVEADVLAECYAHRVDPLIDGTHCVGDVIELSFVNKFEVCKLLAAYLDTNVIEPVPPEAIRQNARTALRGGDIAAAIRNYEYLMSTGDYPAEVIAEAAEAHEANRDYPEAAAMLRRLAEECVRRGDVRTAIDHLRRVANYPKPEPEALRYLLELAVQNTRAVEEFASGIVEAGKTLVAWHLQNGQRNDALALLEKLVRAYPEEVAFAVSLVNVYYEDGNVERAAQECERLAAAFLKLKRPAPAVSLYKKLLIIDPERHDIRDKIRKIAVGQRARSSPAAFPRIAIALAVTLLLGGAAVVMIRGDALRSDGGSSGGIDRAARDGLMASALAEMGSAEEHGQAAAREYDAAVETLGGDILSRREALLTRVRVAQERYELFRGRAGKAQQILETLRKQTTEEEVAARSRAMLLAIQELSERVDAAQRRWSVEAQRTASELREGGIEDYSRNRRLRLARDKFLLARKLSPADPVRGPGNLDSYIENIEKDIDRVAKLIRDAHSREEEKDWTGARRLYVDLLTEFGRSDLVENVRMPVELLSIPPGSSVFIDDVDSGLKTPAILRLEPERESAVRLSRRGFEDQAIRLGPFGEGTDPAAFSKTLRLEKAATWERNLRGPIEAAPAAWPRRVAVAGRNGRWAVLDAETGEPVSDGSLDSVDGVSAGLVSDRRFLYMPALEGVLYVVDALTCKPVTRVAGFRSGLYAAPCCTDSDLYIVENSGKVSAFASRGFSKDREARATWTLSTPAGVRATPTVSGEHLIIVSTSGDVTVIRRATGEEIVRYKIQGTFSVAPAVSGSDDLIFGSEEGDLLGVAKLTGEVRWRKSIDAPVKASPIVRGRYVFAATKPGELTALDCGTGDVIPLGVGAGSARTPVASDNRFFFASGQTLAAFAARGDGYGLAWIFTAKGRILAGPIVEGEAVYVGDDKGNLYRLEAKD